LTRQDGVGKGGATPRAPSARAAPNEAEYVIIAVNGYDPSGDKALCSAAALSEPVILVLEDYHLIVEPIVHEGVEFLPDRLPRQLHLAVCTRADPPLAFAAGRDRLIAAIAGLSTLWVGIAFYVSKPGQAEAAVLSGIADADMTNLCVSINLPYHAMSAVFYTVSLFLLLRVAMKARGDERGA
jgi:hypothetical protein